MKTSVHRHLLAGALLLLWAVVAWVASSYYSNRQLQIAYATGLELAHEQLASVSDGIDERLKVVRSLPALLAHDARVVRQLALFPDALARGPGTDPKKQLTQNADLAGLNAYLALAAKKLGADILWVINPVGDTIAASNFDQPSSFIGANYSDRQYFTQARTGREGMQYAVGRLTHKPGLFYASPVFDGSRFMGVVVAKIDVANFSHSLAAQSAFMADVNGVIVLTLNPSLENKTVPDASALYLPEAEKLEQYQQHAFEPLLVEPWRQDQFKGVVLVGGQLQPQLLVSRELVDAGIVLYVPRPLTELIRIENEQKWIFVLLLLVGLLFMATSIGAMAYQSLLRQTQAPKSDAGDKG